MRPPKHNDPADFQKLIDQYFDTTCEPTVSGLALHLDLTMQGLREYGRKEEFADIVEIAKQRVQHNVEHKLIYGQGNATGAIFWLKNHAGYSDQKDVNLGGQSGNPLQVNLVSFHDIEDQDDDDSGQ